MIEKLESGYALLSRGVFDSSLWQLPPDHFRVAMYLLLKARHKPNPHTLPDGLKIGRGELVTSMARIAENCSFYENRMLREMGRKKALNILENLENIGFLKRNSHSLGTHITICNYDTYQTPDNYNSHKVETPREHLGNTSGTPRNTNKKVNNEKNDKTTSGAKCALVFPESLNPILKASVETWLTYKAEKNQRYKQTGFDALIKKLESMGTDRAASAIQNSMACGYSGVFEASQPQRQTAAMPQIKKPSYVDPSDPHGLKNLKDANV